MLRSLLRLSAAVALAALLAPGLPSAAASSGLAYDELVRVIVSGTPPPPGSFSADVAALNASPATAVETPTPAPKRRGFGLGQIAQTLASGGDLRDVAAAAAGNAAANATGDALQKNLGSQFGGLAAAANGFLQPHLFRHAYLNGWERVDDVTAQTATIRKCDLGQVITLDLAHKTYRVFDPKDEPVATQAPLAPQPRRGRPAPEATPEPEAPGTAVVDFSTVTRPLTPVRFEGTAVPGYDDTATVAVTHATGSCKATTASIRTVEYLPSITRPSVAVCPVVQRAPVVQSAEEAYAPAPSAAAGGCRPTPTFHRSGPTPPTNRLALYTLVTFAAAGAGPSPAPAASPSASGIGFLTERGNLKTLTAIDASRFSVPQGFTKLP